MGHKNLYRYTSLKVPGNSVPLTQLMVGEVYSIHNTDYTAVVELQKVDDYITVKMVDSIQGKSPASASYLTSHYGYYFGLRHVQY